MDLEILWQRMAVGGRTCDRCEATEAGVRRAAARLRAELAPRGIGVALTEKPLPPFAVDESNRVFFNGRPLEDILGAQAGRSSCPSCGGLLGRDTDCRTLVLGGREYEALPEDLLVQAGLLAAQGLGESET